MKVLVIKGWRLRTKSEIVEHEIIDRVRRRDRIEADYAWIGLCHSVRLRLPFFVGLCLLASSFASMSWLHHKQPRPGRTGLLALITSTSAPAPSDRILDPSWTPGIVYW